MLQLDSEIDAESPLANYTGLNYKFDLNTSRILDSMYVGNEMRYLNHEGPTSSEEQKKKQVAKANCRGKVIYVNGVHKILFYANGRIEAGSELFIDYGLNYWTSHDNWEGKTKKVYWR
ncbi:Histone-lysine N-methyltransferase EZA1 [Leucoagaricus sp. SymC.cos]|nr:Histone-lysine N-methyltransferase EZA1 [Leucoagaricus sp. SymC.cos]